jgi:hypothetical protein
MVKEMLVDVQEYALEMELSTQHERSDFKVLRFQPWRTIYETAAQAIVQTPMRYT